MCLVKPSLQALLQDLGIQLSDKEGKQIISKDDDGTTDTQKEGDDEIEATLFIKSS